MRLRTSLAVSGLALSAFLIAVPAGAQDRIGASGLPTTESTPAERAETRALNNQIQSNNAAVDAQVAQDQANYQAQVAATNAQANVNDAQYQAQQQQYQNQLQRNRAQQQQYQDKNARYNALRARYAAERAAYNRAVWPERYRTWVLVREDNLIGNRVSLISGSRVGTVRDVATKPDGTASGLLVELDGGKMVWIDANDVRRNRADGVVMTNLDRADIMRMADQRL